MTGYAAEAHPYDVHLATLPRALGWASAQGPASEEAHTALQPPGGPPPEETDDAMYILSPSTLSSVKLKLHLGSQLHIGATLRAPG